MKSGMKPLFFIWACAAYTIITPRIPDGAGWRFAWGALLAVLVGSGIGSLVAGISREDRQLTAKRKEELRVKRIRELEEDLGYAPLELGDPTEPVRETRKERQ